MTSRAGSSCGSGRSSSRRRAGGCRGARRPFHRNAFERSVKWATSRSPVIVRPRDCWKMSTVTGALPVRRVKPRRSAAAGPRRGGRAEAERGGAGGRRGVVSSSARSRLPGAWPPGLRSSAGAVAVAHTGTRNDTTPAPRRSPGPRGSRRGSAIRPPRTGYRRRASRRRPWRSWRKPAARRDVGIGRRRLRDDGLLRRLARVPRTAVTPTSLGLRTVTNMRIGSPGSMRPSWSAPAASPTLASWRTRLGFGPFGTTV